MPNSSFDIRVLPDFNSIDAKKVPETVKDILDINRHTLKKLLDQKGPFTWDNLIKPLEAMNDELHKTWSPIAHLHSVKETDELREAYNLVIPELTQYSTEYSQNVDLYNALVAISESEEFKQYTPAQKKLINNDIRDFKLAGVNLSSEKKEKLAELQQAHSMLMTKFSENVLDATAGWTYQTTNADELSGLPDTALQLARDNAKLRNFDGFVLTLDFPSFSTARKFLNNRELRKKIYEAYVTRASEMGPNAGKWDNTKIIEDILKIRHEMAEITGFHNFAEVSLATKMAHTTEEVLGFLNKLVEKSNSFAQKEFAEVEQLAKADGLDKLENWDLDYYSEKLRQQKYNFSQEDLRPYFPIEKVMQGMFEIVHRIYGISLKEEPDVVAWHPDVKFYSLYDDKNNVRGGLYIDLYARRHKREGAWMDDCMGRRLLPNGELQHPVAYLNCNFMPASENKPALLTLDDVTTLFHEFGHCLHHMLTQVDVPSVAGINGVPWDAVEFPSQFMENFCFEEEPLSMIAAHYETGERIPAELYEKMLKAKYFQTGLQMIRQLEFALFDFRLHLEFDATKKNQVQTILNEVREQVAIAKPPTFSRFQNTFSHIFAGGYAAGYYSYKWAEVLSADAYAKFEENGILDRDTGKSFMHNILEVGGVREPMDSFVAFRGRKPTIDALLKHSGIN